MKSNPRVSVCMITYGHEAFIAQAINGVFIQETNFDIELIIANDCSPDATDTVGQKIIDTHPKAHIIKYTKHPKNIGMMQNFVYALSQCQGDYIALCEGDDYWTDPLKLQKQVDFLEKNNEFIIHSANARIHSNNGIENKLLFNKNIDTVFEIQHFYKNNNIVTCTVMFRNESIVFPHFFDRITFGDWFLYIMLMSKTKRKAYQSNEVYSVYRIHSGGVMSSLNKEKYFLSHIFQIKSIQKYCGNKYYSKDIQQKLNFYFSELFLIKCYEARYREATLIFIDNLKTCTKTFPVKTYMGFFKIFIKKTLSKKA